MTLGMKAKAVARTVEKSMFVNVNRQSYLFLKVDHLLFMSMATNNDHLAQIILLDAMKHFDCTYKEGGSFSLKALVAHHDWSPYLWLPVTGTSFIV